MRLLKIILPILFLVLCPEITFGQPGGGGPGQVPLTGIEYLLGVGALWGAKKIYNRSKEKNNTPN